MKQEDAKRLSILKAQELREQVTELPTDKNDELVFVASEIITFFANHLDETTLSPEEDGRTLMQELDRYPSYVKLLSAMTENEKMEVLVSLYTWEEILIYLSACERLLQEVA